MSDPLPFGAKPGLSPLGQAEAPLPNWDPLLRLTHWGIAVAVLANYAFTKPGGSIHIAMGWAGRGLGFWRCGSCGALSARARRAFPALRPIPLPRCAIWPGWCRAAPRITRRIIRPGR